MFFRRVEGGVNVSLVVEFPVVGELYGSGCLLTIF